MNVKKFWLACLVVYLWQVVANLIVHIGILGKAYDNIPDLVRTSRGPMWLNFIAPIFFAILFCYIFTKGYEKRGMSEGFRYGLLMGLILCLPKLCYDLANFFYPAGVVWSWFFLNLVAVIIAGVLVAALYKPAATEAPTTE